MQRRLAMVLVMSATAFAEERSWHRVVGVLQYLERDYPAAIASGDAAELKEQLGLTQELVAAVEGDAVSGDAKAILQAVAAHEPSDVVTKQCRALAARIIETQGLTLAPSRTPDLARGAALFQQHCSTCHGSTGAGDGPAGASLEPRPANFHDSTRMDSLTPYAAFTTIAYGVQGTAMPAFQETLSLEDRWALAFQVFTFRQPVCGEGPALDSARAERPPANLQPSLETLATTNDSTLARRFGSNALPCLRTVLPQGDLVAALGIARGHLDDALRFAALGQHDAARQAIVDGYLLGVEPIEPVLRARNPALVAKLEKEFTDARIVAQQHGDLRNSIGSLRATLATAAPTPSSFWAVFATALLILLREGFEATVVVGALLAMMKKLDAKQHVRVVHAGWSSALVFGALLYMLARKFFEGANREWMEATVALLATGMLLYAALWLNARTTMSAFMTSLRTDVKDAMGRGSLTGLFLISFTSVARESVETVLFLEGLAHDSPAGAAWGALAGLTGLLALILFVRRVGFVLPMKALFSASTALLFLTAVMLLGKGLHGFQELGVLPLRPAPWPAIEAVGIFSDWLTVLPQAALLIGSLAWKRSKRPPPPSGVVFKPA